MKGHSISLMTPNGRISAWRADPPIPPRGAIVVIQEIFGVNAHIRGVVERFAAHGYTAIAPALFDHFGHKIELAYDEEGVARGRELVDKLGFDKAVSDVRAAVEEVDEVGHVGVVGYCWGGTVAFLCNTRVGLTAVSYYGGRTVPFLHERPRAPLLMHFGASDPIIPPDDLNKTIDALPQAEVHIWPAGHGFNCEARADYNADVAKQALERTLSFFGHHLRGRVN